MVRYQSWTIVRGRQRHGGTDRRVDRLRALELGRQDCGARSGRGHEPLGHQYRDLLHRLSVRRVEFHHDSAEHAHERHVVDAYAIDLLGVVYDCGAGVAVLPGAARRRHSVAARSRCGHQLLYPGWTVHERSSFRLESKFPVAHGRFTDSVAAPLLVLWAS